MNHTLLKALVRSIKAEVDTDQVKETFADLDGTIKGLRKDIKKLAPQLGKLDHEKSTAWRNQLIDLNQHLEISLDTIKEAEAVYSETEAPIKKITKLLKHCGEAKGLDRCYQNILHCQEALDASIPTDHQIIDSSLANIEGVWSSIRAWANKLNGLVY